MLTPVARPEVRIVVDSCQPENGHWRVAWRVHNEGRTALSLNDAWIPHGRFRGDGHIPLSETIGPGEATLISFTVTGDEPPNTVVENAYLILRSDAWRIFARMRVEFDAQAVMQPIVETVTLQSIQ
jgi:hypothetical protein